MACYPSPVGLALDAVMCDRLAFVTAEPGDLQIANMRDLSSPQLLSAVPLLEGGCRLTVFDQHAHVVSPSVWRKKEQDERSTVFMIEASDPRQPSIVTAVQRQGPLEDPYVDTLGTSTWPKIVGWRC